MFRIPQSILFAMIAFNFTAFAVLLQMDMFHMDSLLVKLVAWVLAIGAWALTYQRRKKVFTLF